MPEPRSATLRRCAVPVDRDDLRGHCAVHDAGLGEALEALQEVGAQLKLRFESHPSVIADHLPVQGAIIDLIDQQHRPSEGIFVLGLRGVEQFDDPGALHGSQHRRRRPDRRPLLSVARDGTPQIHLLSGPAISHHELQGHAHRCVAPDLDAHFVPPSLRPLRLDLPCSLVVSGLVGERPTRHADDRHLEGLRPVLPHIRAD
mmetsp:Transcript_51107/g.147456  ORF Transcript_51107/g.147456 Transcript_51107/m.147456 type:complete len:202 (-) Transcript_51107:199-804(-)